MLKSDYYSHDAVAIGGGSDAAGGLGLVGLLIGGAGTVKVTTQGGTTLTLTCVAGQKVPLAIDQVFATGTTATDITGLLP